MNHSSLFAFEESSIWDPKVVMKRLIVPEDQLIKLNSIPGWKKVQNNQNSLRLDKDFSIESSQSECSVIVTQNSQRIEKNTELFDEQTENRKSILETYKVYRKKLTRSLSFISINKSCENLFNSKTLKRSLSLQSICQLSDTSAIAEHLKNFICENSAKRHLPSDHSEPQKSEVFLNKENNSKTMETALQLPVVKISTPVENATLHSGSSKENNAILPAENAAAGLKQLICTADQPTKHFESVNILLHSETAKENNGVLNVDNADLLSETGMENNSVLHANKADSHSEATKGSNDVLADNVNLHSVAIKASNSVLPAKNASSDSNNIPDQLITHDTEFTNANKADLHSETTEEEKGMLQVDNVDLHSEATKDSNDVLADNADLHSVAIKVSNSVLPAKNTSSDSNNTPDLLITHDTESTNANNADLHSETTKEEKDMLQVDNVDLHSEATKDSNDVLADNADLHSVAIKVSNSVLPAKNASSDSNNTPDLLITHDTESTKANNADLHYETTKEEKGMLQVDNVDLHSETAKENNDVMFTVSTTPSSSSVYYETAKTVVNESVNADNYIISSVVEIAESHVPVSSENDKSDKNYVKEGLDFEITTTTTEYEAIVSDGIRSFKKKETIPSNYSTNISNADDVKCYPERDTETSTSVECFVSGENIALKNIAVATIERSNDMNLPEPCSSKSSDIPAKELFLPKEKAETKPSVKNSGPDMENDKNECGDKTCDPSRSSGIDDSSVSKKHKLELPSVKNSGPDMENDKKECGDKTCDPSKSSGIDETSVSKKRKLELRNKRSKKHKSEEKQGNLKIRSIKRTGEICYSAEEIKTMLNLTEKTGGGPSKSSGIDEISVSKKRKLEPRNERSKKHKSEKKLGNLKIRSIKRAGEICYSAEEIKTMLDLTEWKPLL